MPNPQEMTDFEARMYYKAADNASAEIMAELKARETEAPFGQIVLVMALAKWLTLNHHEKKFKNDDLEKLLEATQASVAEWTREYAKALKES